MGSILLKTWPVVVAILMSTIYWTHVARPWVLLLSALLMSIGVQRIVTWAVAVFPHLVLGAQIAKVDTANSSQLQEHAAALHSQDLVAAAIGLCLAVLSVWYLTRAMRPV